MNGTLRTHGRVLKGLTIGATTDFWLELGENTSDTARCAPIDGTVENRYVHGILITGNIQVTLLQLEAQIDNTDDTIHFPGGLHCNASSGICHDHVMGTLIWDKPTKNCPNTDILYTGPANVTMVGNSSYLTVYTPRHLSAFRLQGDTAYCSGNMALATEHSRIFVLTYPPHGVSPFEAQETKLTPENTNQLAYINTKF